MCGRGELRGEHPRGGDHLERRTRWLQPVEADPGHRQDLPAGRAQHDDPAVLAAERGDRRPLHRRRDRGADRGAGNRRAAARTRPPANSSPPAIPRRRSSNASSRPLSPTLASAGTPSASSSWRLDAGAGPTVPTSDSAALPSGELRVTSLASVGSGPCPLSASTLPSRASSVARRGRLVSRLSASPGRRPGNASDRDHAIRVPRVGSSTVGNVKSSDSRPNNRVSSFTGELHRALHGRARRAHQLRAGDRRGRQRLPVGVGEFARRDRPLRGAADVRVHARVIAPCPGRHELLARPHIRRAFRESTPKIAPLANAATASTRTGRARRRRWLRLSVTEQVEHDR